MKTVGKLDGADGEGGVRFDVVGDREGSGVVGAVVLAAGVSGTEGGAASWLTGDVTGAFGLQPTSIVNTKNTAKTPCIITTAIIRLLRKNN